MAHGFIESAGRWRNRDRAGLAHREDSERVLSRGPRAVTLRSASPCAGASGCHRIVDSRVHRVGDRFDHEAPWQFSVMSLVRILGISIVIASVTAGTLLDDVRPRQLRQENWYTVLA